VVISSLLDPNLKKGLKLNNGMSPARKLTCGKCGFELTDIKYFAGENMMKKTSRVLEFFCPKCKSVLVVE
jgi:predicted RNA-binding Zn-ribbon protein involved in translation (DUF1610 family)